MKKGILYIIYALIVISISWIWATQVTASKFGYPNEPEAILVTDTGERIYLPFVLFRWYFRYFWADWSGESPFDDSITILFVGAVIALAPGLIIFRRNKQTNQKIYGDAHFLSEKEMKKTPYVKNKNGVVIGQYNNAELDVMTRIDPIDGKKSRSLKINKQGNLLVDNTDTHILLAAPTRGGKGVGPIISTLLFWQNSVFVYDIKKENWEKTSGFRSLFSRVLKVDFLSEDTAKWNPLLEIRIGTKYEVSDAQQLAEKLRDPYDDIHHDIWREEPIKLLTGLILYVINNPDIQEKSIRTIYSFLSDNTDTESLLIAMQEVIDFDTGKPEVNRVIRSFVSEIMGQATAEKQFQGVITSTTEALGVYMNPLIAENTSSSDFRLSDIMRSDMPVSLYYCVAQGDQDMLMPLTRLFHSYFLKSVMQDLNGWKHRCLWLIDEFLSMKKMPDIARALAVVAGYGVKMMLVIQDLQQLYKVYDEKNEILGNCNTQIYYTPTDFRTAEEISRALGQYTVISESTSSSGHRTELFNTGINKSYSQSGKALMNPTEVMSMPYDEEIIFMAGYGFYKAKKNAYYSDRRFNYRADLPISYENQLNFILASQREKKQMNVTVRHKVTETESNPVPEPEKDSEEFIEEMNDYDFSGLDDLQEKIRGDQ